MKKSSIVEMKIFRFVKKVFFIGLTILSNFANVNSLSCVSVINQECKTRPEVINGNVPVFFQFSIETSKCTGSCNNINYPYVKICVSVIKNLNVKVFNLMSRTNETRNVSINSVGIKSKCKCECKESTDKGVCNKGFIWNPSNCECDCDKV